MVSKLRRFLRAATVARAATLRLCAGTNARAWVSAQSFIAAGSLLFTVALASAQSVTEPGFETPALAAGGYDYDPNLPTPGQSAWTFLGASGIANIPGGFSGFLNAPEGSQVAFLQTFDTGTASAVCQNISGLVQSVKYFVSARLATRTGCGSCVGPAPVEFRFDDNLLRTVAGGEIPADKFTRFAAPFIPTATDGQLCIAEPSVTGLGDASSFVDDVIFHIFIEGFESIL